MNKFMKCPDCGEQIAVCDCVIKLADENIRLRAELDKRQWIPVSDCLKDGIYFVYNRVSAKLGCAGKLEDGHWFYEDVENENQWKVWARNIPTHYTQLPEPPEVL